MLPNIPTEFPPQSGATLVLLVAALGLLWELRSTAARASSCPSLWLSLAFGSLSLLSVDLIRWISLGIGVGSGWIYARTKAASLPPAPPPSRVSLVICTVLAVSAIIFLLLLRLDPNFRVPLVWESVVILSFLQEIPRLNLVDALGARFLWMHGLVSDGDYSLLYGFPTAVLLSIHSSLTSLRVVSVILFIGATLLVGAFCRRFLSPTVGVATLVVFGLNEVGLIFGRYASSLSGTLFAIIAALYCCATCVAKPGIFRALLAGGTLYIATLGYSPARPIVVVLLGATLLGVIRSSSLSWKRRALVVCVICAQVWGVIALQERYDRAGLFTTARYEQFFGLFLSGTWPDHMLDQWNQFSAEHRAPTTADYVDFVIPLVSKETAPQLIDLISPFSRAASWKRSFYSDPLHQYLYESYLFPFLLLGLMVSRYRASRWLHRVLIVWLCAATIPILFTNRVDSYRSCMALLPLSIYIGMGIGEALQALRRSHFPSWILTLIVCGAIYGVTSSRIPALSVPNVTLPTRDILVQNLEPRFIDRALIGVDSQDFKGYAQTQIILLRRKQLGLPLPAAFLSNEEHLALTTSSDTKKEDGERAFSKLLTTLNTGAPVILGPLPAMNETVRALSDLGYKTYPCPVLGETTALILK